MRQISREEVFEVKRATVVIGSSFGDEGKGLMTDYFSHSRNSIVVRFNGGTQAGHTVITPDGKRHVHGHFGSGTLNGSPTYLSKYFVVSPHPFLTEQKRLVDLGSTPKVFVDPRCIVTTPFDVYINRAAEASRGADKHGSCGEGVNETTVRNLDGYGISVADLYDTDKLEKALWRIKNEYLPKRLFDLNVDSKFLDEKATHGNTIHWFLNSVHEFLRLINLQDETCLKDFDNIVFEGAQGLLLDQNSHYFPYVTRSNTGLTNAEEIASDIGLTELDVVYVTRCYKTRHGVGPLLHEQPTLEYNIVDQTNKPNLYQDSIRFAYLDVNELVSAINKDFNGVAERTKLKLNKQLAITCLDQIAPADSPLSTKVYYYLNGIKNHCSRSNLVTLLATQLKTKQSYLSFGATRSSIREAHLQHHLPSQIESGKVAYA